ncbi:MAG TPA: hypothetical protein EYO33_32095 [Phycisphaerales bacterium]|nr:hypothetical protein [Phycisphaerales bacterium]
MDKDGGLPSAHALSFISARLKELAIDVQLANSIDEALFRHGIPIASVTHLTFVFSGNPPQALLNTALAGYQGQIPQWGVGLHVANHTVFVAAIYQQVIANANNP